MSLVVTQQEHPRSQSLTLHMFVLKSAREETFDLDPTVSGKIWRVGGQEMTTFHLIASRIPVTLWAGRLSITTHPRPEVGYHTFTYVLKASASVAPGKVISPTSPRSAIAPISVKLLPRWYGASLYAPVPFSASIASCHCQITACFIDKHQILQIHGSISLLCTRSCCTVPSRSVACRVFFLVSLSF